MGFSKARSFLEAVRTSVIRWYGGVAPEARRKAPLDAGIPGGGTIQGYGVKFFPPGTPMAGQNERSTPAVMQYIGKETVVVWPSAIKTKDPVLPLPKDHAYAP